MAWIARVAVEEAPDLGMLARQSHLRCFCLAAETAEAILNDSIGVALETVAVGDDAVDLELELGTEVLSQSGGVDKLGLSADEEDASSGLGVLLLCSLDAVPHDTNVVAVDCEAVFLIGTVEGLGRHELEEDDLGCAAVVLAIGLRGVDVSGIDASGGAHRMNGGDEAMSGEGGRQVNQEEGAVKLVGNVGGPVAHEVRVSMVFGTESKSHLGWCVTFISRCWVVGSSERSDAVFITYQHRFGELAH